MGLDDNESFDENNSKFREHEAQWRLNKRGVDGETIIHLLLNREEPSCAEIARILIHRYPGLAKDIYMGEEMFGQSALHLAIVHDDYDTVQLLLEKGAAVNARACGNFFLPDDVSENNVRTYTYQGSAQTLILQSPPHQLQATVTMASIHWPLPPVLETKISTIC